MIEVKEQKWEFELGETLVRSANADSDLRPKFHIEFKPRPGLLARSHLHFQERCESHRVYIYAEESASSANLHERLLTSTSPLPHTRPGAACMLGRNGD